MAEDAAATVTKEASDPQKEELWPRLKSVLGHVGLLVALMLYTVAGGLVSTAEETVSSVTSR